ncbi:MAG: hypothetical protein PGN23_17760 [Sphingomonas adhaesiva]|uniref:hypothetical protein n=1 Tax=Sphingomonas adhaesiva TaxID=28212 RepID=UPI002FFBEA04
MTRAITAMALAAMLAACSGGTSADYNRVEVPEKEARAQAAIDAEVARSGAKSTARLGVPVATPTPNAARDRAFPAAFRGFWGASDDDCELANTAATGRIDVDGDTIRFYESKARVQAMRPLSPIALSADLRFDGEGQATIATETYRLENGDTTLSRTRAAAAGQPALSIRYKRC